MTVTYPNSYYYEPYSGYNQPTGNLTIPSSVTHNGHTYSVTSIGSSVFRNCSGLTSVTIPSSVTSIGGSAFRGCSGLTSVTIPNSVTSIGELAFSGCSSLTSVTIPNSVTSIGESAFYQCSGLTSVVFNADSCTFAGGSSNYRAFYGCPNVTNFTFANNVKIIPDYLCCGMSNLTSLTIPNSVTSIGNYAFDECSGLTGSLTIPNSVTSIGESAFEGCSGLSSVTIPNSVTTIGNNAFSTIPLIYYSGSATGSPWGARCVNGIIEDSLIYTDNTKTTLVGAHKAITTATIPNSVTSIGDYAFSSCSDLTSITIPNSVTSIGDYAFSGCHSLTSVTIPNSVTSIGSGAFSYCTGLTSVTIPNSVTSIGDHAFSICSGLTSVTIPNSVTTIGYRAFAWCSGLVHFVTKSVYPPACNKYTFQGVPSYCTLTVPSGSLTYYNVTEPWASQFPIKEED